jgi:hypothetical protein
MLLFRNSVLEHNIKETLDGENTTESGMGKYAPVDIIEIIH